MSLRVSLIIEAVVRRVVSNSPSGPTKDPLAVEMASGINALKVAYKLPSQFMFTSRLCQHHNNEGIAKFRIHARDL